MSIYIVINLTMYDLFQSTNILKFVIVMDQTSGFNGPTVTHQMSYMVHLFKTYRRAQHFSNLHAQYNPNSSQHGE